MKLTIKSSLLGLLLVLPMCLAQVKKHDHGHSHDEKTDQTEKTKQAAQGVFEDVSVKDRPLSDWMGDWQSLYPHLLKGVLDPVFKEKAEKNKDKTAEAYKAYYEKGYKTDVQNIKIDKNTITFSQKDKTASCEYESSGFKILTYVSGKRGVRYLFECKTGDSTAPKFIQFSDHIIEPTQSSHYHIYMGNESHETLLKEMENWPTYFPSQLDEQALLSEMLAH